MSEESDIAAYLKGGEEDEVLLERAKEEFSQRIHDAFETEVNVEVKTAEGTENLIAKVTFPEVWKKLESSEAESGVDADQRTEAKFFYTVGWSPEAGEIDGIEAGSKKRTYRDRVKETKNVIQRLGEEDEEPGAPKDEVVSELVSRGISEADVEEALDRMMQTGEVYIPDEGRIRTV